MTNLGARDLPGPLFKKNTKNGTITKYPNCYLSPYTYNNYDSNDDITNQN